MADRLPAPALPGWLESQLPFERYMVEVGDGLKMHIMEQGEGPPVVLFHGNPTWGYLYRRVANELAGDPLRLIMPDLIGLGFSDPPGTDADHTLPNHSRWMADALEQLDVSDAVYVVQDWGGPVGVHTSTRLPGSMSGLVVLNTMLGPPKPGFKPTTFHRLMSSPLGELFRILGFPHRHLGYAQGDRKSISGVVQESYSYPLKRSNGGSHAALTLSRMVPDSMEHPSVEPLREVQAAVEGFGGSSAIVWGWRDPVLGKVLRRIRRMLPDAEVTETQAGHFIQEECPDEIAAAIRSVAGL